MPLSTTPRLGSMVITAGASWKFTFQQFGLTFTRNTEARIEVTDRAGGLLGTFYGELSSDKQKFNFTVDAREHEDIPGGANWELFIDDGDAVYKVLYGRVVRAQVETPLNPAYSDIYDAVSFEDDFQRSVVGPYWTRALKAGRLKMYQGSTVYGMASDTGAFASSAALYYAPLRSDSIELTVGLWNAGAGKTTVALCSNSAMSSFLGVQFDTGSSNRLYIVVGTGPTSYYTVKTLVHAVPQEPLTINNTYRIMYSEASRTVSVYQGNSLSPLIEWTDEAHIIPQGPGYRYTGLSWKASLLSTGSRVYYWKAKDTA